MRSKLFSWAVVLILVIGAIGPSWADDDARVIGKLDQTAPKDARRTVSIYLTFEGDKADGLPSLPSGTETRFYSEVWDNLYLQVTTETGEAGIAGYMFTFSTDEDDQKSLTPEEPKGTATLREISAADFRTSDNFKPRPLKGGPGVPDNRGAFRLVSYNGFELEIRVLEFKIGDAKLGKKPYFKSLSCVVTVREKPTDKAEPGNPN